MPENAVLRRISALADKDFADLFKNPGMLASLLMPIGFVMLMAFLIPQEVRETIDGQAAAELAGMLLTAAVATTVAMVGAMAVLHSLAEEKEKRTLRTLILSNVSAGQIACAKALVGLAAIVLVQAACFAAIAYMIPSVPSSLLIPYLALGVAGGCTAILPSLVLGLACRDQTTASFYSVPVVLLAMAPTFGAYGGEIEAVVRFMPTGGVCDLMGMIASGSLTAADAAAPIAVTVAWIAAGAIAFKLLYRKLAQDN